LGRKVIADDLVTEPIFSLLELRYSTPLLEAEYQLEASIADAAVAMALSVSPGSPIFLIERTSYSVGHQRHVSAVEEPDRSVPALSALVVCAFADGAPAGAPTMRRRGLR